MKNNILKKYLIWVIVYTGICVALVFVADEIFNGVVLDFLYANLPRKMFYLLNQNRTRMVFFAYCVGIIAVSTAYVFKLNRLLNLAGRAI